MMCGFRETLFDIWFRVVLLVCLLYVVDYVTARVTRADATQIADKEN